MSVKIVFEDRKHYLHAVTQGQVHSVEELMGYSSKILHEMEQTGHKRMLMDELALSSALDPFDFSQLSDKLVNEKVNLRGLRIAGVVHPDNYQTAKEAETILLNRSLVYKGFLDQDEALEWLLA